METNIKNYIDKFMQAFSAVAEELIGKEKATEALREAELYAKTHDYSKDITAEDVSIVVNFLYDKLPDSLAFKKKHIDNFRMDVNCATEVREAGVFFTEDSYYTVDGIIENVKEYLNNFKDWMQGVGTTAQEVHYGKEHKFTFRAWRRPRPVDLEYCELNIDEKFFFKKNKKSMLLALRNLLLGFVKGESREKFRKALLDMLPEDFFTMDGLLINDVEIVETKEPTATPKDSVWSLVVQDTVKALESYGSSLNHPARKNPDMIGENIENMRDFLYDVNKAVQRSFNSFLVRTQILKALMTAKDEYRKRAWYPFTNHGVLTMLDNKQAGELLFKGAKLIIDCLKDDICCFKIEYYPRGGALEFRVYPTKKDEEENVREFFWDCFLPRDFSERVQTMFDTYRPLINESKKDYFLKKWIDLFPNTEVNEIINLAKA